MYCLKVRSFHPVEPPNRAEDTPTVRRFVTSPSTLRQNGTSGSRTRIYWLRQPRRSPVPTETPVYQSWPFTLPSRNPPFAQGAVTIATLWICGGGLTKPPSGTSQPADSLTGSRVILPTELQVIAASRFADASGHVGCLSKGLGRLAVADNGFHRITFRMAMPPWIRGERVV